MGRGSKPSADGVKKRRFCRGRKRPKTTDRAPSKLSAGTDSSASSLANTQPTSEPVQEQYTATMSVLEQEPGRGQDTALVEQLKALVKQNGDLMKQNVDALKQNADLAALLKESKRKLDVMTKNAERAKKNYISEKKANNRKYEDRKEELKQIIGNLNMKHDATRQEVADLNAAMHFVLERGHEGKYFDKMWSKTREWTKY
ncbi:hypothetical protein NEUTE1DRAFT_136021 [Neurospora tetrasperma FGSC 2508]|uniref:Uncharacterized protein n=1 Tax=Neurospora tetrasperma (strain FGSC 2508 / ATCC MYA-4615 / P0657) TaxID=510951 RepID=F8MI81_NEUT8|nr:uncharacterized protein NEUTE1DRAFT_136021 [Neurospora tetrasperma FGSC 2508]EGO58937.1 hypothetical protein NEUTE1DRAFT_136021 [Neurospora tetrasperma FGSC 2508]EGZ73037.1 hypothetical protein NEUTE2DRAFT_61291 [Neurospora tetrasperma FGSC 2509]